VTNSFVKPKFDKSFDFSIVEQQLPSYKTMILKKCVADRKSKKCWVMIGYNGIGE
jgi:hypothetical protein